MTSLNDVNGAGICLSVDCDERARLYDLVNRVQIPAEAEIFSPQCSDLLWGPPSLLSRWGIGSPFNRLNRQVRTAKATSWRHDKCLSTARHWPPSKSIHLDGTSWGTSYEHYVFSLGFYDHVENTTALTLVITGSPYSIHSQTYRHSQSNILKTLIHNSFSFSWTLLTKPLWACIATRYGLDGPGIESWWEARFSTFVQTGPGAHPASYTMGTGSLPGVKRPGRGVDHPPHLALRLKKV
jgi:hypothetical protein